MPRGRPRHFIDKDVGYFPLEPAIWVPLCGLARRPDYGLIPGDQSQVG